MVGTPIVGCVGWDKKASQRFMFLRYVMSASCVLCFVILLELLSGSRGNGSESSWTESRLRKYDHREQNHSRAPPAGGHPLIRPRRDLRVSDLPMIDR